MAECDLVTEALGAANSTTPTAFKVLNVLDTGAHNYLLNTTTVNRRLQHRIVLSNREFLQYSIIRHYYMHIQKCEARLRIIFFHNLYVRNIIVIP